MDDFTKRHFETWLQSMFRPEEQDQARVLLLQVYDTDPQYYEDEGWPVLLRDTETEFGNCTTW